MFEKKLLLACGSLVCGLALMTGCSDDGSSSASENFWNKTLGTEGNYFTAYSVHADDDAVYIAGRTDLKELDGHTAGGENNLFVQKYDKDGNKQWSVLRGSSISSYDFEEDVYSAFDGTSIYTAANIENQTMMHMLKTDASTGNVLSNGSFSAGYIAGLNGLAVNDRYLAAVGRATASSLQISLFNKENRDLVSKKTLSLSDTYSAYINSVCFCGNSLYVAGWTYNTLSWDGQTSEDPEDNDSGFIARFSISDAGEMTCTKIAMIIQADSYISVNAVCSYNENIYITGRTDGAIAGTMNGDEDLVVAAYSADLSERKWIIQSGKEGSVSEGTWISVSDNGIYVTGDQNANYVKSCKGMYSGSKFLMENKVLMEKYDFEGNRIWSEYAEGPEHMYACSAAAVEKAVYFAAYDNDSDATFLIKHDK